MEAITRRILSFAASLALALAIGAPAAQAATKYEFHDVTFSNGQSGTIYASTKTMKKKPDYVYCQYKRDGHEFLGYYDEFVADAPSDAMAVRDFCLSNFEDRQQ